MGWHRFANRLVIGLAMSAIGWCAPAHAEFYENKTLTLVVNFAAGGNADTGARTVQRFLARHIPGHPNVIVQNVPGAMQAVNMLGLGVNYKPDGLTAGYFGLGFPAFIVQDPSVKVPLTGFIPVGAVKDFNIAYARKDVSPGINRPEDIVKVDTIYAGGYGRGDTNNLRSQLALEVIGARYRIINGFPGTAQINKAMLQNEIGFANSALPGYLSQALPQLIQPGIAIPLFYFPTYGADGALEKQPDLEKLGISSFSEVYERIHGRPPSGAKFDALMLMCGLDSAMHGAILFPKGTPSEAVQVLRNAFDALGMDQDFRDAYAKISGGKPPSLSRGVELERLIEQVAAVSPDVKSVLKEMMKD